MSPEDATDTSVTYESSDSKIATVDDKGVATGVSVGSATITVKTTDGALTATSEITVKAEVPAKTTTKNTGK